MPHIYVELCTIFRPNPHVMWHIARTVCTHAAMGVNNMKWNERKKKFSSVNRIKRIHVARTHTVRHLSIFLGFSIRRAGSRTNHCLTVSARYRFGVDMSNKFVVWKHVNYNYALLLLSIPIIYYLRSHRMLQIIMELLCTDLLRARFDSKLRADADDLHINEICLQKKIRFEGVASENCSSCAGGSLKRWNLNSVCINLKWNVDRNIQIVYFSSWNVTKKIW